MNKTNNTSLNNFSLMSKQTPFRASIVNSKKKKAQKLVPKLNDKSKVIKKGEDYSNKLKSRKNKRMSLKKKSLKSDTSKREF